MANNISSKIADNAQLYVNNIKTLSVIITDRANEYLQKVDKQDSEPFVVAIDGPCASGKSTLADQLVEDLPVNYNLNCSLIRADHFFLPPDLRTEERLSEPGGNIHRERFLQEVAAQIKSGETFSYGHFDCRTMSLSESIIVKPAPIIIVEGAYSHHPLWHSQIIDLTVFCEADLELRVDRIRNRNGEEGLRNFLNKWIPLENKYFTAYNIRQSSDIIYRFEG